MWMRESGKHRNTSLYTTMIKGYGLEKNLGAALDLFREMPLENVPYNTITYNSIIDACVKGGDLATAESLLHEIAGPNSALEPDLITFSTLLKGYCHGGDLDKALQLTEAIKVRGLRCDELVYNTLMDGCVKANDVQAGVGLFEEMIQQGMRPSTITHSILARLYQRAGYEDDANEAVAQLYRHHGIERPTGGDRDRGKGAGRRGGHQHQHQRSPLGRGGASPTGSQMSGWGGQSDRSDAGWNNWGETGYDAYSNASAASTPHGSPMHQTGGHGHGVFLPLDMQGVPPLPGMSGSEYGTPMSSYGSYGSPCMSPSGMDQMNQQMGQGAMMNGAQYQASQAQVQFNGQMGAMPSLPPWPFAGGPAQGATMSTFPQATTPGVDMGQAMPQFYSAQPTGVPMMQQPHGSYGHGNMQAPNCVGSGAATPTSCAPGGASPSWPGQPTQPQQSPFPMPLSGPVDLMQPCVPQASHPQQAYFELMPGQQDAGQSSNGQMTSMGGDNPFCM